MDTIDTANKDAELYKDAALANQLTGREKEKPLYLRGVRCCLDCTEPIPEKRLEANPDAVRCVACQGKHEGGNG